MEDPYGEIETGLPIFQVHLAPGITPMLLSVTPAEYFVFDKYFPVLARA